MDYDIIALPSGKKLSALRVQDLKKELTKRRLSTAGKKAELSERLAKNLLGHEDDEEAMEVDQTLEVEEKERFVTPDRENTHPEEDPQLRKSTKASRVRPHYQPIAEDPMEGNPFLSDDDEEEVVAKPPASASRSVRRGVSATPRSRTHTVSPAKPPASARRSALREVAVASRSRTHTLSPAKTPDTNGSRRISAVALRTRSRSPQLPVATPGSTLAGATTPQRPATGRGTPKSAAVLFANDEPRVSRVSSIRSTAVSATRSAPRTARRALLQDKEEIPKQQPLIHKPPKPTGRVENRFAAQHKKLDDMEETLAERQMRILERHEKMNNSLPDVVKRLNTPKQTGSSRVPIRPQNEAQEAFKFKPLAEQPALQFGNVKPTDIALVQKDIPSTSTSRSTTAQKKPQQEKLDVKARTKAKPKLTVADDDTFTEYMATPKGKTPAKTPSRTGYTPKTGGLRKFVDTSKLSDHELQLAREEGLIGGGRSTAKKSIPANPRNHKKRTEEILNIRRKLNL